MGASGSNIDSVEVAVSVYDSGYLFPGYIGEDVSVVSTVFYGGPDYNV